ncbi:MAG: hypothetical protein K8F91_06375, partial [Candidatus Obscuribacterales bacterium]|nr:hypothetical protein [Candidatus Obscuribacterales bacterium]
MTFKDKIISAPKLIAVTLTLAVSMGFSSQSAQADDIVTYSLGTDVVELVRPAGQTMITADGEIVTTDGRILGVVSNPGRKVTVVRKVPTDSYVTLTQSSDMILAASLSNRIAALEDLANRETRLGNVADNLRDKILVDLRDARAKLRRNMSYSEALKIGLDLDQIAMSLKRSEKTILVTEYALRPMVVEAADEPS